MLSNKTFLVTGATGRLGCEISSRLEELGAAVLPLVLNAYPMEPKRINWTASVKPIVINGQGDLKNLPTPDYTINLHWCVNRNLSFTEQLLYELDYNVHRPSFLWSWLLDKSIEKFVNVSSIKIFSFLNKNPITSKTEPRPSTPYGIAKAAAENFFDAFFSDSSIRVVHLRLCSVTSFGEHPSQLLTQLFNSAFDNTKIRINANHTSNIIYIDEAVDLIINAALNADQGQYIFAPDGMMNNKIASKFERISRRKLNAELIDFYPGMVDPKFVSDISKFRSSWSRITSLEQIIQNIIFLNQQNSDFGDLSVKGVEKFG